MTPTPILQLVNILGIGGAEGQFVERVRTIDPRKWRPIVACLKKTGPHLGELERAGIDPVEVPLAASLAHPRTALAVAELAGWMRREGVKLVHAQDFYTNLLAVPAARLAGAKVIVSRLDLAHWHGPRRRKALALATRLADCVQVNAHAIARQLVAEERLDAARIRYVGNGLDLARFDARRTRDPAPSLGVPPGAFVVTVVANLHPVKGQEDALAAVATLSSKLPDLHLVLVGDGDRRAPLEERARALGIADRVRFLGHRADVPAVLAASHVQLSTSYAEGLSNSIIEGMASRLPVIATAVGGSPELVADGERGLLVPPRSPLALARAIERLATDEGLRRRLGEAARAWVEAELELGANARAFDRLYEDVLLGRASSAGGEVRRSA